MEMINSFFYLGCNDKEMLENLNVFLNKREYERKFKSSKISDTIK